MIRRIPRWARWVLVLLSILLVIYLIMYAVMTSTAFSRFALDRVEAAVPALSFSNIRGSLTQGLRFDLRYMSEGTEISAQDTRLMLLPDCFVQLSVCVEQLQIERLIVVLTEGDAASGQESEPGPEGPNLPSVSLPVDITLEQLIVASLLIQQDGETLYQMEDLRSSLAFRDGTLFVEQLTGSDPYCQWALQEGKITLINQYPLSLQLACESKAGYGQATAELNGDLDQVSASLQARVKTEYAAEAVPLEASFTLAPLSESLPMRLRAQTTDSVRIQVAEQSLQLAPSQVGAEGPLLSPQISARLDFQSPFWPGNNQLVLEAAADTEALRIQSLALQLPEGQLEASGQLNYAEAPNWQAQLAWQNVDLSQFDEALEGQVNGQLTSRGEVVDGDLRAQLALESLSGTWLEKQLTASGRADWAQQQLTIEDFRLQQGPNQVALAGTFSPGEQLEVIADLNVPQVGALIPEAWAPEAAGEIRGQVKLAGSPEDLVIRSSLKANRLQYADLRLTSGELQLQWFGLSERRGKLELVLNELALSETLAGDVVLRGEGNIDRHSLQLSLAGLRDQSGRDLSLQCSGGFADPGIPAPLELWEGECEQLQVKFSLAEQAQVWRLASPFDLQLRPQEPAVAVEPFCLINQPARLCSGEAIRFVAGELSDIRLTGSDLPVVWLEPFLPGQQVAVSGGLQFQLTGSQLLDQPQLSAQVGSQDLAMRWAPPGQQPLTLTVEELDLGWRFQDQQHQLNWQLKTAESGSTSGAATLAGEQIKGQLSVTNLQLGNYSRLFLPGPEDSLSGEVNAQLQVAGSVQDPALSGQLRLSEGRFNTELLPLPLRDIQLQLNVNDNRAVADGSFRAAESDGRIDGEFAWQGGDWSGQLSVAAEPLMIQPEPGMQVHVAPDLKFRFAPGQINIAGEVRVPEAQVEITELPEQAVRVSSDTVIVGEEDSQAEGGMNVSTNIEISLGDKVFFEGFGLETKVTGKLRLQQQAGELLKANGKLQLVEGRYKAYGQNLLIRNGDLVFVGDIDNPQIRLEAVRADTPEDVTVGLRASGPARSPRISLFSNPDMPQQAQLSFLLTGNPPGTEVQTDPQVAAAEAALSYALESDLGAGITRRAGDALGIDDLKVTAGATDAGTQIGLSGYITPNLLVRYGVGVFDAINTLTLRYQLTKNVYLEAISGETSDVGVMWSFERD